MIVLIPLGLSCLAGCSASKSRAKSAPPAPDSTGTFVDEYFFGYNHRGDRNTWADALFMQVRPAKEAAEGWTYVKGNIGNMVTCMPEEQGK